MVMLKYFDETKVGQILKQPCEGVNRGREQ